MRSLKYFRKSAGLFPDDQRTRGEKEVISGSQIQAEFKGADEIREIAENQSPLLWIRGLFGGDIRRCFDVFL